MQIAKLDITLSFIKEKFSERHQGLRGYRPMLRHREPSDDEINRWLSSLMDNNPITRKSHKHWQVDITSPIAFYKLDIVDHGEWMSFGVALLYDVHGPNRVSFYRDVLNLNAQLNGVRIGLQGSILILTREVPKAGLDPFFLAQSLAIIQNAHLKTYPYILDKIHKYDLKAIK